MLFTVNHEERFEGNGIADGTYEVIVKSALEQPSNSGTMGIKLQLVIRNDIENQRYKNMIIFETIWSNKETGEYRPANLNQVAFGLNLENGKQYKDLQEFLDDLVGKVTKVTVKNETSEWNGKTYENLRVKRWEKSGFPVSAHVWKEGTAPSYVSEIKDADLPF